MNDSKYMVLHFPALDGDPEFTDWWLVAFARALRWHWAGYEARIVNTHTGNHVIL